MEGVWELSSPLFTPKSTVAALLDPCVWVCL